MQREGRDRVLVVDDNLDIRVVLRTLLEDDFDIIGEAENGYDAVALAEEHKPDFVVLDSRMPPLDGPTAAPEIRKVSPTSKIFAFSAYHDELPDWADAFLVKSQIADLGRELKQLAVA